MSRYDFSAQRLFVDEPLAADATVALGKDQSNYLLNVLRLSAGESLLIFNGRDGEWRARLGGGSRKQAVLEILDQARPQDQAIDLDYLFAPLKHARLDYMVQKAVEMGVRRLRPVMTRRTQATRVNLERMRANAIEAVEQCGILNLPEIAEPVKLGQALANWPANRLLIFCDEDEGGSDPVSILRARQAEADEITPLAILIGPEGGFDPQERAAIKAMPQAIAISLGPRILRADTAAVAALAVVQAAIGDWSVHNAASPDAEL